MRLALLGWSITLLSFKPRPGKPSFGFLPDIAAKPSWKPFNPGCWSGHSQEGFLVCVAFMAFYGGFGGAGCYGFGFEWCGQGSRCWRSRTANRVSGNTTNFFKAHFAICCKKTTKTLFCCCCFFVVLKFKFSKIHASEKSYIFQKIAI